MTARAHTTIQVRFGGLGGQGIVLAGRLLGKAAALFDGKDAVCTQTYGPEARGGASRTDVIISDAPVDYPFVTEPDVLAVLFQEAYERFRPELKPSGVLIVDPDLVRPDGKDTRVFAVQATKIAEDLGSRLATNVVLLGYLVGVTRVVSRTAAEEAIRSTVGKRALDLDLRAFAAGFSRGQSAGAP